MQHFEGARWTCPCLHQFDRDYFNILVFLPGSLHGLLLVSVRRTHLPDPSHKGDGVHLKYVDTIAFIIRITMRQRNSYPKPFKAQVVQECLQPGVSMASVALHHGINANLVRKWIPTYRYCLPPALPAFVPMKLAPTTQSDPQASISIDIPFGQQKLTLTWPTSDPDGCARFIRELAR